MPSAMETPRDHPPLVLAEWSGELRTHGPETARRVILGRLRGLRLSRGLTAQALAESAGLPVAAIVRLEAGGFARYGEVAIIATALAVTAEDLTGLKEAGASPPMTACPRISRR